MNSNEIELPDDEKIFYASNFSFLYDHAMWIFEFAQNENQYIDEIKYKFNVVQQTKYK